VYRRGEQKEYSVDESDSQLAGDSGSAGSSGADGRGLSSILKEGAFPGCALLVGERIDLRAVPAADRLASAPVVVPAGGGVAVLFRYGVAVFFGLQPSEEAAYLAELNSRIVQPFDTPEEERVEIRIDAERQEGVEGDTVYLREASIERLQLVAHVLSASAVLGYYEAEAAKDFDRIEPFALGLQGRGRAVRSIRELLAHISGALLREQHMVGRVGVSEKPELLWEHPELERLYARLEDEFELRERHLALEQKLQLVSRTAQTVLDVLQDRRILRVEWYIVILILVEIVIMVYELFLSGH
jgi:uncharacterized Rmd1/YagE family protein